MKTIETLTTIETPTIETPWPGLKVYAALQEEIDPYDPQNKPRFRGEEAFAPDVQGWQRWSKPSPEPKLDAEFEELLLASIKREALTIAAMTERLAQSVLAQSTQPLLLIAILRAGVPVGALLRAALQRHLKQAVPLVALSLFHGLGWDARALERILRDYPDRQVWFVDGWTSGGNVAQELQDSYACWLVEGQPDFTGGDGPQLAVLNDPRGRAAASAVQADVWVPSACFTAPETLGFSRGFAFEDGSLFGVYRFPHAFWRPALVQAWLDIAQLPTDAKLPENQAVDAPLPPAGWRVHINEVVRALINRSPREVWLSHDEEWAHEHLAPVLHLCRLRGVPVQFARDEVRAWGALAASRMTK